MEEPLSPVDTTWFRMEAAKNSVDIVSILFFAGPLDHDRFRDTVERRLLRSRRFRQRVERRRFGRPRWVDCESFSLDEHVHFRRLPEGAGREALEAEVSRLASERMDVKRPLWDAYVFDGYEGNRSVLVSRLHHAMGDGFALMTLLLAMADEAADGPRSPNAPGGRRERVRRDALERSLGEAWKRRAELAAQAKKSAASLAHLVRLPFDPANDLRGRLSGRRLCTWSESIPLERIKEIGRGMGGATVNDVVLTALAGALRRYLAGHGEDVDAMSLRAMVPVNLRPPQKPIDWDRLGNYFGLVYLDLPVQLRTPAERLVALHETMNRLKRSPDAYVSRGLLFALGFVPTRLSHAIDSLFARKGSIVATNVPGPRKPLSFAGQRVDDAVFFVPHPGGLAVGASIFSYAGALRVGIRTDVAVVDDPRALARAFEEELDALPRGPARPRARAARPGADPRAR